MHRQSLPQGRHVQSIWRRMLQSFSSTWLSASARSIFDISCALQPHSSIILRASLISSASLGKEIAI